tara:strand:- start:3750 stop:5918 length:2169 start_codon:yes stop_codon:yes gene_type:complete
MKNNMEYRYLKNLREKKVNKFTDPLSIQKKKPKFSDKAKFREWCANENTDHVFYSTVEGDNPSLRIQADNPPNTISGIVADYDAPVDWDIVERIINTQCKGLMPTWISRTQSGYMRLVWEFKKIPISPDMFNAFMQRMCAHLRLDRIFAGFDRSSLKSNQYFELGEDWKKLGEPLQENIVQTVLLKAAMDKPPQTTETSIPMEVVAEEALKRFPDRWMGEFSVGERGPLFWIDDGIEREGCQLTQDGVICYSDRAGKGFLTWREILGKKFVENYETKKLGNLLDNYWFNGKNFFKLLHGTAVSIPKDQLVLELRKCGFLSKPKKGQTISEVDAAVLTISNENRIHEIAPIIWSKERVVDVNSHRILNSQNVFPIEPDENGDPKKWQFIHAWLNQLFVNEKRPTIEYFHAYMKRFYESVFYRIPKQGQGLILVGPTGRGKTLVARRVIGALVGGYSDASEYICGQTSFNKELARVPCWCVDDTKSAASFQDQRKATEIFKRVVANPDISYMAKYCDEMSIPWTGRIILTLNMDANSLSVIPALDSSNRDKVMALRISDKASKNFPPNSDLEDIINNELPHYARWLLDWDIPKEIVGRSRYGVVSYIDKSVASAAYDNSSRSSIAELVEFFAKKAREYWDGDTKWRGTLTEFQVLLHEFNGGRSVGMSNNLEFVRRGMLIIEESCKTNKHVRPVKSLGFGGGKVWEIDITDKYDIDKINNNSDD